MENQKPDEIISPEEESAFAALAEPTTTAEAEAPKKTRRILEKEKREARELAKNAPKKVTAINLDGVKEENDEEIEESEEIECEFNTVQEILDDEQEQLKELREYKPEKPDRSDMYPKRVLEYPQPEKEGLNKDFKSFELLWYDLENRVREVVKELNEPIYDEMTKT